MLQFDEEGSRRIEATYMTPDVVEQRRIVLASLDLQPGESVLDVGSGPGLLAAEMAEVVGPEGTVQGIEPSESMLAIAARREPATGSAPLQFQPGDAVAMPFADASFDAVVSTQVYEYLEDVAGALAEVHRVLRPGGRLVVLDTDWGSVVWRCNDAERMDRVLAAWDEHLADPHLPRRLSGLLEEAGFTLTERAAVPILNAGYDPNTYSAGLIGFVSTFVPGRHDLTEADVTDWADELVALGRDYFFSVNRYVFAARAGASVPDRSA